MLENLTKYFPMKTNGNIAKTKREKAGKITMSYHQSKFALQNICRGNWIGKFQCVW